MSEKKNDQPDEAEVKVTEEPEATESSEPEAAESSEAESAEAAESSEAEAAESSEAEAAESSEAESAESSEAEAAESSEAEAAESNEAEAAESNEAEVAESSEAEGQEEEFVWPSDPEHANAAQLLSERVAGVDVVLDDDVISRPSYALNFALLVLVLVVGGVGVDMLREYSSADRDARMSEQALCRVEHNDQQQLLAEKQYGALRIESEPKGAKVERSVNGAPYEVLRGKTASGEEIDALTQTTASNLDINNTYKFRLTFTDTLKRFKEEEEDKKGKKGKKGKKAKEEAKAEGEKKEREVEELKVAYRTEEFYVARYQWIQDGATGAYRTQKVTQLVPQDIAHYYTFDWKSGKDLTFETLSECEAHVNDSDATICRAIPAVKNWDTEDARREEEAKKSKKRGRRRR